MKANRKINLLIKQRRKEKGWSQDYLAEKVGISRGMLINCEKGLSMPRFDTILQLMDVLGCGINSLIMIEKDGRSLFKEGMRLHLTDNVHLIYENVAKKIGIKEGKRKISYEAIENIYRILLGTEASLSTDIRDIVMFKSDKLNIEPFFIENYQAHYAARSLIKNEISQKYRLTDEEKEGMLISKVNHNEIIIESNYLLGCEYKKSIDAFIEWVNNTHYGKIVCPIL